MTNKEALTNYVQRIVSALYHAGVKDVVISPGSRSTPLAYAFALLDEFTIYRQIDERSAGFFALGLAKASQKPVVLLCTSGTAASNYYPAITEANYARVPLIAITADRPHELREVGAPQAIHQVNMYGEQVKWSVDFPLAEPGEGLNSFVERHIQRGISTATSAPFGPVHFNIPFREPLLIDFNISLSKSTFQSYTQAGSSLSTRDAEVFQSLLAGNKDGLIIVGEVPVHFDQEAFWTFAEQLNWPVLCDPLSNLRSTVPASAYDLCIDQYDAFLKSEQFRTAHVPDIVLRFGAQPVSKPLAQFLQKVTPDTYITIDEDPMFRDSIGVVTHHLQASAEALLRLPLPSQKRSAKTEAWIKANKLCREILEEHAEQMNDEGAYTYALFQQLPNNVDFISGSSMPIRDTDTYFGKTSKSIHIFANRGTNGIDGVVSTALGIQAHRQKPTYLLIGDLSFLHDVNGLIATRFHKTDLTIIIMNNDGGGIFSYLPQATIAQYFEDLFGTPTGLNFKHIASMYEADYAAVTSLEQFNQVITEEKTNQLRIIEVFTDRKENVQAHRQLWQKMIEAVESNV